MSNFPPIRGIMIPKGQEVIFGADPVPDKPGYVREMFAYWDGDKPKIDFRIVEG